jgi:predicted AAA+ superfamily ATPase
VHDAPATLPAPVVQYPSLHVKGIHTTAPTDTSVRKNTRLIEVRRKRIENKEKRHSARVALERAAAADIKAGGKPGGRAARIAAKQAAQATKTAAMDVDVSA